MNNLVQRHFRHFIGLIGLAAALGALAGCGRNAFDIVPAEDKARAALEKALTAWKGGQKCGAIGGGSPAIQAVDGAWQEGKELESFEILKTLDKPGPRWFAVKLTFKDDPEPQQTNYAVVGIDPLWVCREAEYGKECDMAD